LFVFNIDRAAARTYGFLGVFCSPALDADD
jgi:hypothetical protein